MMKSKSPLKALRMFEDPDKSEKLKPFSLEDLSQNVKQDSLNLREGAKQE